MEYSAAFDQTDNRLLAALAPADFEQLRPSLERIALPLGLTLSKSNLPMEYVYFLERGMVSLVQALSDGTMVEVGVVGREGFVGMPVLLGATQWPIEAMVQLPGAGFRVSAPMLSKIAGANIRIQQSLLRYMQALIIQISQTAACNAHHKLDQRLARWLLVALDRADGFDIPLRHEFLGMMLGTNRAGVSRALSKFRAAGLILTGHSRLTILDRHRLEAVACECYRVVNEENDRLLA